ncbi:patatin-like phospholipase family protein [Janthinobacterium sp. RB2R34]|uniref:patatin-like phospholipase family protein n=1 Tax=Janthinobacterium sp. RB2R34 TaxID=3424193 RepID=UPI003F23E316
MSPSKSAITIRLGRRARARIAEHGMRALDVAIVPAAAGGPKGLILHQLDCWLFGDFLPQAPRRRQFIGASIGAWRMAAATLADPVAAQRRLVREYVGQRYPDKPASTHVSRTCRALLGAMLDGQDAQLLQHAQHSLAVLAVRGIGPLARPGVWRDRRGFLLAAAGNTLARDRLAASLERVVFHAGPDGASWLRSRFDAFNGHFVPLAQDNLRDALLASGSIPLVLDAVTGIAGAPPGRYWDGGLVDYHLHLPYQREPDLVLYPHFSDHIVPGWLDKAMPWRRVRGQDAALDNLILVSPSPAFVASLPNGKLPDRRDFAHYGQDHAARIRDWRRAIAESERMAAAFARWAEQPDLRQALDLHA